MKQTIPGSHEVKDREFMYIEVFPTENFHQVADSASAIQGRLTVPSGGGVIEENVRLKLDDGVSLIGVSYKGDIEGWRRRFVEICTFSGRRYGFIRNDLLIISNGEETLIGNLKIDTEKTPEKNDRN